ncbi:MAG TPA: DivIVA domain-containing protein [Acidimicrobiales bacterium]|nr:DivIVA domain-containing protein [Acidimicrobiales bacterium]
MPEDVQPISSSRLVPTEVARHSFGTVRRGFDPQEVRTYLELVARELSVLDQHDQDLRRQLAAAEDRSLHPVIDEATLTTALGQQSAQVLRDAHEESARITREAEEAAAELVREAQGHAAELQVQAEAAIAERMAQADLATGSVQHQAQLEAERILQAAGVEGEAVVARAREQGTAMVEQAQEARRRVLADMAQRRHAMTVQIEQFRAARDELAASVQGVRQAVDRIVDDLDRADDSARAAAADVARRQPARPSDDEVAAEVERVTAELDANGDLRVAAEGGGGDGGALDSAAVVETAVVVAVDEGVVAVEEIDVEVQQPEPEGAPTPQLDEGAVGPATDPFGAAVVSGSGEQTAEVPEEASADAVEGLFARLRASRPHADAPGPPVETSAEPEPREAVATAADEDADTKTADQEPETPDDAARRRAGELLEPVVALLARRVKRALQDDQNALLDRLRSSSDTWSDKILAAEDEQRARYVEAATPPLREAAVAGITMARELRSARGRVPSPDDRAVTEAADGLAGTVVTLLRRQLTDEENRDAGSPADRVGAAFREWRGERIERLVGDCALAAFSSGVLVASGKGAGLRWLVGGSAPACADCDDNSLAGTVPPGDEFPTGHRHPPAHAGCRCLVVPTPD